MPEIDVTINSRGAITGARKVEGAFRDVKTAAKRNLSDMDNYGKKTRGSFDSLKKSIFSVKGAVVGLAASLGSLYMIKQISDGFMDTAKAFEAMEIKLNALTRGRGIETLERINAWAMTMPVNTRKAVDAFTMMQAMGLQPTIDKMQTLVDVSAIFGEDAMPRVARALGQMQTLSKVSAEELNQLAEAGINARKYLKEAFGQTVEELQKSGMAIEKIVKAIMDGMKAEFGGAAEAAMKTWSGMTITLVSYWEEFKRQVMDSGPFDALKEYMGGVVDKLAEMKEAGELDEWSHRMAMAIVGSMQAAVQSVMTLYNIYKSISKTVLAMYERHLQMMEVYYKFQMMVGIGDDYRRETLKNLTDVQQALADLGMEFVNIDQAADDTNKVFETLLKRLEDVKSKGLDPTSEAVKQIADDLKNEAVPSVENTTKAIQELTVEIKDLNEEVDSGLYQGEWEMIGDGMFYGYDTAFQNIEMSHAEMQAQMAKDAEAATKKTTEKVWTLWDESLNRVQLLLADTFYDQFKIELSGSLSLLEGFLNSLIRLMSEKLSATVMAELFGVATGAGGGPTGTGGGGGFGSLWDWLGLAKSGYEGISGNSLLGSLYNLLFGGGSSAAEAGLLSGMGLGGSGGSGAIAGGAPAYGAAGTTGSLGAGSVGPVAGAGIMAAAVAAVLAINAIFEHNMGSGPSSVQTQTKVSKSADPNKLFTGEMYKAFSTGGEWDEGDAKRAAERVAGMIADTLDVYNVMFANLSDSSKETLRGLIGDIDNMEFWVGQYASEGGPVTGRLIRNTPNEISSGEWGTLAGKMQGKWISEFVQLPELSAAMQESIITAIEDGGELTGQALADIMGVSLSELEHAFADQYTAGLADLIQQINDAYAGGWESLTGGEQSIPKAFQDVFGKYFEGYIEESLANIKGKEVFGLMSDEIQKAIEDLSLKGFLSDVQGFSDSFTKHVFQVEKAAKIWESLNAFIGRASDEVTAYEVASAKATIHVGAYAEMLKAWGVELTDEEIAAKIKSVMGGLTDGIGDLNAAMKPLGAMGQLLAALNGQFDAYLELLRQNGVDLAKITQAEEMRFKATERLLKEYKIAIGLFGEDYAQKLRLEEISERYARFGLSHEQMLEAFKNLSLKQLKAIADAMGLDWTTIADDMGALAAALGEIGKAAEDAANNIKGAAEHIREIFLGVNDFIGGTGLAEKAERMWTFLLDLAAPFLRPLPEESSIPSPEDLANMSDRLAEWFYAAEATARELGQAELAAIQLEQQVVDKLSSLVNQIDQTIRNIKYSDLNVSLPFEKAEDAQKDYATLFAAAKSGGTSEVNEYLGFTQTYLQQQQNEYKSSQAYQDIYAQVMSDMETIKGIAESGGYDAKILEELQKGNQLTVEQTAAYKEAMVDVYRKWDESSAWIANWIGKWEGAELALRIDWGDWDGDKADAMRMLLDLAAVYGWGHDFVLKFVGEVPMSIFQDLDDMAQAAGWLANASGGWESAATLSFLKNVASNWEFEDVDEILRSIGLVADGSGGYGTTATITYMAELMDRFGVPLANMPDWLNQMGISDNMEIADIMAKLVLQTEDLSGLPVSDIDDFLKSLGIEDTEIRRNLEVSLLYNMHASGDMNMSDIADWAYAKLAAAAILPQGSAEAVDIMKQVQQLGALFGVLRATGLGNQISVFSPLAQAGGWADPNAAGLAAYSMWDNRLGYTSWATGGIANEPTWGVFGDAGPEAFLRLSDNTYAPIPNGGSTQAGANRGEEIALLKEEVALLRTIVAQNGRPIELGGKPLDDHAKRNADIVIKQRIRSGNLNSPDTFFR